MHAHANTHGLHHSAKVIAKCLKWYGPLFSPKNVPRFYDLSSLTENPKVFSMVITALADRYKAAGRRGPTHVAGYDARLNLVFFSCLRVVCACVNIFMWIYIVCVLIYVCVCLYICVCVCVCVYVYTYIHTYIHTCIHTHTFMHTYIHACTKTYIYTPQRICYWCTSSCGLRNPVCFAPKG